jgi:hypothetical protein
VGSPTVRSEPSTSLLSGACQATPSLTSGRRLECRELVELRGLCDQLGGRGGVVAARLAGVDAEDQITRIFEKFYRIDQKESISGTGLGLTVVKEIVEAHNGEICVTSKLEKGSKFSIILNQLMEQG